MMLKEAFKNEAMGITQVYEWFNHFKRGKMSVEDQLHCGRPSTSRTDLNLEKVRQAVLVDCHQIIDEISEIRGVSWSACQRILTEDLMMKQAVLKGIKVTNLYEYFKYIFCNNSRNFLVPPRKRFHISEQQRATTSTRIQRNVLQISSVKLGSTPVLHLRVLSSNLDLVTHYSQVLRFSTVPEQKAMIIPQKLPTTC